ncbi:MAG: hypothetical protein Q9160_003260 [Pyrenula sp. 1 TL-2023]
MSNRVDQSNLSSTSAPRPFPFLRLPKELREQVFDTVFDSPPSRVRIRWDQQLHIYGLHWEDKPKAPRRSELGILCVSKQIRQEAGKIFWKPFILTLQYSERQPGVFTNTDPSLQYRGPEPSCILNLSVFRALRIFVEDYTLSDFNNISPQHFVADVFRALENTGLTGVTTLNLEFDTCALIIDNDENWKTREFVIDEKAGFQFGRTAINDLAKRLGLQNTFEGVKSLKVGRPQREFRWQLVSEMATSKAEPPLLWNYDRARPSANLSKPSEQLVTFVNQVQPLCPDKLKVLESILESSRLAVRRRPQ